METFITGVDNAEGDDAQAVNAQIQAGDRALEQDLRPIPNQSGLLKLRQKAIAFMVVAMQQKIGNTVG